MTISSGDPEIRVASPRDIPSLADLRWRMHVEEEDSQVGREQFVTRFTAWADRALIDDKWHVWVALVDLRIVGHVYLECVDKVPRPVARPVAWGYLTAFYVEESYRSRGVGQHLLRSAIDWATSSELEFVQAWPSRRSVELYQRLGFVREDDALVLRLES